MIHYIPLSGSQFHNIPYTKHTARIAYLKFCLKLLKKNIDRIHRVYHTHTEKKSRNTFFMSNSSFYFFRLI